MINHRQALLLGLGILLTASACSACSAPQRTARAPHVDETVLRVATYNVNYGLAGDPSTLRAIADTDADVICLQETTPAWEEVLRITLSEAYPHMEFIHSGGAGGAAVLSRLPILETERLDAPEPGWFPAWRVVTEGPGEERLQLLVLHLRPPVSDSGSFVSGYFQAGDIHHTEIVSHYEALDPEMPTVVLGDFNEGDDGDAVSFLREKGLENALPLYQPDADTWRWTTSVGQITSTLDHVMYNKRLDPIRAEVRQAGRSDHLPIVVDFSLKPAPARSLE